jgi:DNA-directed RNA polymerase specialized sigma24 family protein
MPAGEAHEAIPFPGGRQSACDPALVPFLDAPAESARERMGELIERTVAPLARKIVRGHLPDHGRVEDGQDRDDVEAGVLLRLSEHLWSLREPDASPIGDLAGYVAATAHNACHAFLRRRSPERVRLRNKVRYLLTHDAALALWQGGAQEWLCGLSAWRGTAASVAAGQALQEARGRLTARGVSFVDLVRSLLRRAGGPCRLDELVATLAGVLGVSDAPQKSSEAATERSDAERLADPRPDPAEAAERSDYLARLWQEIRTLPAHQRTALLLNLRDAEGRSMIGLFPLTGLVSQEEIAQVLEMPMDRLQGLWNELPKDDEWIAQALGVTRRQVINFRKCARERLARRMSRSDRPASADAVTRPAGGTLLPMSGSTAARRQGAP